jgi:16S rRNA (adenine1518-N6/adenine1519-N6)-dimethyltransferase
MEKVPARSPQVPISRRFPGFFGDSAALAPAVDRQLGQFGILRYRPGVANPRLKKALAQHHLVDGALCRPLLEYLQPAGRRVLEVGSGGGVLTAELLRAGAKVIGWELDPDWAFTLRRRLPGPSGRPLRLVVGDALEIPWGRLPEPTLVAGNLPYNVATAILERLLPHHRRIPRSGVLVQKEVAERLVARAGDEAYGSLSVLVAAYARARLLGRVRPGSFRPPPKVESAFVGFELHPPPLPEDEMPTFIALVRRAFAQRRKTLRNGLAAGWGRERAEAVLAAAGIPGGQRAEELGMEEFLRIYGEWKGAGGGEP